MVGRWWAPVAVAVAVAVVARGAGTEATPSVSLTRHAGEDRYETASVIAESTFPADGEPPAGQGTPNAIVATGQDFPDALVGTYVAGQRHGPILLTQRDVLPETTASTFNKLGTHSADIIGDASVVSTTVSDAIASHGIEVDRWFGGDRYETAVAVAHAFGGSEGVYRDGVTGRFVAILVSGEDFPDALSAGAIAYSERFPLLLTPRSTLHPTVKQFLDASSSRLSLVFVIGGTAAISNNVVTEIEDLGIEVRRIAGSTRQATAVAVAEFARQDLGWAFDRVVLARGDGYADAIAGGALAGELRAPLLLTATPEVLTATTADYISQRRTTIRNITVLGGQAAITDAVAEQAQRAATGV